MYSVVSICTFSTLICTAFMYKSSTSARPRNNTNWYKSFVHHARLKCQQGLGLIVAHTCRLFAWLLIFSYIFFTFFLLSCDHLWIASVHMSCSAHSRLSGKTAGPLYHSSGPAASYIRWLSTAWHCTALQFFCLVLFCCVMFHCPCFFYFSLLATTSIKIWTWSGGLVY